MKSADSRPASLLACQWQHGGWLSAALLPAAWLFGAAASLRRRAYGAGWLPRHRAPVPVVVVGNIYVGGTGKTPVVMAVVRALAARGWRPGVVSRGYGVRVGRSPRMARGTADPALLGDEPALIARETGVPVAVHPDRPRAVRALLAAHPDTDVVVSDDGLQHLALARDLEIVVQDERGVGNGRLLPAGPLREPPARLRTVDLVVTRRATPPATEPPAAPAAPALQPDAAVPGWPAAGRAVEMWLQPQAVVRQSDGLSLAPEEFAARFAGRPVAAAAGIGRPRQFFDSLARAGIAVDTALALPDHYAYRRNPFAGIAADAVLVTSKDAVKCRALDEPRLWSVPAQPHFSDPRLFDWLDARLRRR